MVSYKDILESALPQVSADIVRNLQNSGKNPFVVWLVADMGAGKTTLMRHIFRDLGLDPNMPVTSPTFTYMNEYEINHNWYAHLDLYRAQAQFDLEDLGVTDAKRYRGIFVEWPSAATQSEWLLRATHLLKIGISGDTLRDIELIQQPD